MASTDSRATFVGYDHELNFELGIYRYLTAGRAVVYVRIMLHLPEEKNGIAYKEVASYVLRPHKELEEELGVEIPQPEIMGLLQGIGEQTARRTGKPFISPFSEAEQEAIARIMGGKTQGEHRFYVPAGFGREEPFVIQVEPRFSNISISLFEVKDEPYADLSVMVQGSDDLERDDSVCIYLGDGEWSINDYGPDGAAWFPPFEKPGE